MVNHFRTALLNMRPATTPGPGEEYVPDDYQPVRLTPSLTAARAALFGAGADRTGINLTLASILTFLHGSRLGPSLTSVDARITYDPRKPADVWADIGADTETTEGPDPVGWSGSAAFRQPGRGFGRWEVSTDGAGAYSVVPEGGQAIPGDVTAGDLGDAIPLAGTSLSLIVPTDAEGRWRVTLTLPPTHRWASAASVDVLGVFTPSVSDEETDWFAAWSDPYVPAPLKAGALALAASARIHEIIAAGV